MLCLRIQLLFDEKQIQNIIKESNSEIYSSKRLLCDFKIRKTEIEDCIKLKPYGLCNLFAQEEYQFQKKNGNFSTLEELK
jgi:acetolactate synthase-1/3 small subunit